MMDFSPIPPGIIRSLEEQVGRMGDTVRPSQAPIFISLDDARVVREILHTDLASYRGHPVKQRPASSFGPGTAVYEYMGAGS